MGSSTRPTWISSSLCSADMIDGDAGPEGLHTGAEGTATVSRGAYLGRAGRHLARARPDRVNARSDRRPANPRSRARTDEPAGGSGGSRCPSMPTARPDRPPRTSDPDAGIPQTAQEPIGGSAPDSLSLRPRPAGGGASSQAGVVVPSWRRRVPGRIHNAEQTALTTPTLIRSKMSPELVSRRSMIHVPAPG
jgi:hypothetical protein